MDTTNVKKRDAQLVTCLCQVVKHVMWNRDKWKTQNRRKMIYLSLSLMTQRICEHWRMARGGHRLPKVSLGPAMPYSSTPCGLASPETVLRLFERRSAAIFYPFGHPTPYAYGSVDAWCGYGCHGDATEKSSKRTGTEVAEHWDLNHVHSQTSFNNLKHLFLIPTTFSRNMQITKCIQEPFYKKRYCCIVEFFYFK
jgi:hypothetical protein